MNGYTLINLIVRMTGKQSNIFLAILYQMRLFLEEFANPDGNVVVLWQNSVYQPGTTNLNRFVDCQEKLRLYCNANNGDPTGFHYWPDEVKWWSGKTTPPSFKAYAKKDCRVWRIPQAEPVVVGIVDTIKPWKLEPEGYEMDVFQIIEQESGPTWFIVATGGGYKWICLANETTGG